MYDFAPDGRGYVLSGNGVPKLWVSTDGHVVRVMPTYRPDTSDASEYLRALAPRLLFLQGSAVLHGSACDTPGGALAICGDSGAGKTTAARAFDCSGFPLLAEDMLVISSLSPLSVHRGGEQAIRRWALASAEQLLRTTQIEASGLRAAFDGPAIALGELWYIAADQRTPSNDQIARRRLGPTDGTLAVMASLFLGGISPPDWRRFLSLSGTIAASTPIFNACMPLGLDRLQRAAATYTKNST